MRDPDLSTRGLTDVGHSGIRLLCLMPSIPLGGMELAVTRIVERLIQNGAQAHFVLDKTWGTGVQRHVDRIGATWTGVPYVGRLGMPHSLLEARLGARSILKTSGDFARAARSFRPRQVLATSVSSAFFGRRLACANVRTVFRLPNPPDLSTSLLKRSFDLHVWRSVYRAFDALVCNSCYTARRLAELLEDDRRIRVIRNLPPQMKRVGQSDAPRLDTERQTLIYVGQLSRSKGLDILIKAVLAIISRRADVDLVIAGPDSWQDPFSGQMKQLVREAGAGDRIRFLGRIEDVHGLLTQGILHICPSVSANDSFPNVVLEAKQSRIPSIVFPVAGLPEAVENGVDGTVTADCTAPTLAAAIERLLDEPQLRLKLANGAARSLESFSETAITEAWADLLEG